ncbi:hypothetical protein VOLCADRAFT_95263 [Volvox carteri f. nagariensis]|uniref:Cytochrome P450 n=1 Tax=Volvox carteri f. nagariensis TaxID=3068 RepID=D8U717_VOLCA|nr:uncharacterized protein VOLCADRAFT_95263 [Volvox carteri f. nagariensis]EFJ44608.1 hypothetical protein VOLCADRAFT_95263 [Volvox carteri f. nagariensis]|eukprot:XP_002954458.1 hypothetical protein VOLCADRAFT_95263 [Volvox carteri f. nagariensis]
MLGQSAVSGDLLLLLQSRLQPNRHLKRQQLQGCQGRCRCWRIYPRVLMVRYLGKQVLLVREPDDVAAVLSRRADRFTKHPRQQRVKAWLGAGLATQADPLAHAAQRETLAPAFRADYVRQLDSVMAAAAARLAETLLTGAVATSQPQQPQQPLRLDFQNLFKRHSLDVLGLASLQVDLGLLGRGVEQPEVDIPQQNLQTSWPSARVLLVIHFSRQACKPVSTSELASLVIRPCWPVPPWPSRSWSLEPLRPEVVTKPSISMVRPAAELGLGSRGAGAWLWDRSSLLGDAEYMSPYTGSVCGYLPPFAFTALSEATGASRFFNPSCCL